MAGKDDFGITPIEAMASGVPVFGLRAGGLLETNIEGMTGEFFDFDDLEECKTKLQMFHENIQE